MTRYWYLKTYPLVRKLTTFFSKVMQQITEQSILCVL